LTSSAVTIMSMLFLEGDCSREWIEGLKRSGRFSTLV
jgi:hypothetical protein